MKNLFYFILLGNNVGRLVGGSKWQKKSFAACLLLWMDERFNSARMNCQRQIRIEGKEREREREREREMGKVLES